MKLILCVIFILEESSHLVTPCNALFICVFQLRPCIWEKHINLSLTTNQKKRKNLVYWLLTTMDPRFGQMNFECSCHQIGRSTWRNWSLIDRTILLQIDTHLNIAIRFDRETNHNFQTNKRQSIDNNNNSGFTQLVLCRSMSLNKLNKLQYCELLHANHLLPNLECVVAQCSDYRVSTTVLMSRIHRTKCILEPIN